MVKSRDWLDGEQESMEMYIYGIMGNLVHVMPWRR